MRSSWPTTVLALLGAALLLNLADQLGWLVPLCGFRVLSGLPCPLCGGLRTVLAMSQLDLPEALRSNPLVFALCLAAIAVTGRKARARLCAARATPQTKCHWRLRPQVALFAVLVNWFYLVIRSY